MDEEGYMLLQQLEDEEEEMVQDSQTRMAVALAVVHVGAEEAHQLHVQRRQPSRLYLCRDQLLPNPRVGTPWQVLYSSRSDRAFITTMGFDVETFDFILDAGFAHKWQWTTIPRRDTASGGGARPGGRSLDAPGALGLILHYLNSTMREISLQQIFAIIPATVSRYITFGLKIYLATLSSIRDARIEWPGTLADFHEYNQLIVTRHPLLDGAFASIDGLNLPVQNSDDEDIENATFNGWLHKHFVSSVLVFSPKGQVSIHVLSKL
jgi:hypothetical protein